MGLEAVLVSETIQQTPWKFLCYTFSSQKRPQGVVGVVKMEAFWESI
jgi:hypothetical protein